MTEGAGREVPIKDKGRASVKGPGRSEHEIEEVVYWSGQRLNESRAERPSSGDLEPEHKASDRESPGESVNESRAERPSSSEKEPEDETSDSESRRDSQNESYVEESSSGDWEPESEGNDSEPPNESQEEGRDPEELVTGWWESDNEDRHTTREGEVYDQDLQVKEEDED